MKQKYFVAPWKPFREYFENVSYIVLRQLLWERF